MKEIKVVVRPTVGEDIICLDLTGELRAETMVCLGKTAGVRLPLRTSVRLVIEDRVQRQLDWVEIEKDIYAILSASKMKN